MWSEFLHRNYAFFTTKVTKSRRKLIFVFFVAS